MKKTTLIISLIGSVFSSQAQDFESLLSGGEEHAGKLVYSYLQPVFEGTIYNLNNGWYRTAKTHKLLGFDISVNASLAEVPNAKQVFTFNNSDYNIGNTTIKLSSDAQTAELPTALGKKTDEQLDIEKNVGPGLNLQSTFDAPNGLLSGEDKNYIGKAPLAMAQIGIGLIKKTDLTVRFVPEQSGDDYNVKLFGVGLKHNILQYFPIAKRIPLVDVSIFGGYTKLESNYFPTGDNLDDVNINLEIQSYTAQLLGSVDLKLINFYLGLGYTAGTSSLSYNGRYTIKDNNGLTPDSQINLEKISSADFNVDSFKATLGASINVAFLKIFADYSIQEYNAVTAGLALSFK